jgi:hypothetical protein
LRIATVLRSGGEYLPEHVDRLRQQCVKWLPGAQFDCLSDLDGTLRHGWPGWWSKMEMFAPHNAAEPFLYMDLDTAIVGPLNDIAGRRELTALSDFYWPEKVQSSLMLVTPEAAETAWAAFTTDPARHMRECVTRQRWGDQGFLEGVWGRDVARWQEVAPGQAVSYKVHVRRAQDRRQDVGNGTVPEGARAVVFHGKPRPWEVGW